MREVHTTIIGIEPKTSQKTNKPFWVFKLANGEEATSFEYGDVAKAEQHNGQPAKITIEDKGQYKNLRGLEFSANGAPAPGTPVQAAPLLAAPSNGNGKGGFSEADKVRITKLACISTAYGFFAHLLAAGEDVVAIQTAADGLAKKLYNDARSHEQASQPVDIAALTGVQVGTAGITAAPEPVALPWSAS